MPKSRSLKNSQMTSEGGASASTQPRYADVFAANADKNFVQRIVEPEGMPFISNPDGSVSSHLMSAETVDTSGGGLKHVVYPNIVQKTQNGPVEQLSWRDAQTYARDSGEFIEFPTLDKAIEFSEHYKEGTKMGFTPKTEVRAVNQAVETQESYYDLGRGPRTTEDRLRAIGGMPRTSPAPKPKRKVP